MLKENSYRYSTAIKKPGSRKSDIYSLEKIDLIAGKHRWSATASIPTQKQAKFPTVDLLAAFHCVTQPDRISPEACNNVFHAM
jgi:hypothetical protein